MSATEPSPYRPAPETDLSRPYYGASIGTAFARFWKKYATFSGRASRSEFWWWELIALIYGAALEVALISTGGVAAFSYTHTAAVLPPAYYLVLVLVWAVGLATLIPGLALSWRRLHDTNRSGGYYFIGLIPIVGGIILLVLLAGQSDPAGARFD